MKPGWRPSEAVRFLHESLGYGASISVGPGPAWASVYLVGVTHSRHVVFQHDGRVYGVSLKADAPVDQTQESTYEWLDASSPKSWWSYLVAP